MNEKTIEDFAARAVEMFYKFSTTRSTTRSHDQEDSQKWIIENFPQEETEPSLLDQILKEQVEKVEFLKGKRQYFILRDDGAIGRATCDCVRHLEPCRLDSPERLLSLIREENKPVDSFEEAEKVVEQSFGATTLLSPSETQKIRDYFIEERKRRDAQDSTKEKEEN